MSIPKAFSIETHKASYLCHRGTKSGKWEDGSIDTPNGIVAFWVSSYDDRERVAELRYIHDGRVYTQRIVGTTNRRSLVIRARKMVKQILK